MGGRPEESSGPALGSSLELSAPVQARVSRLIMASEDLSMKTCQAVKVILFLCSNWTNLCISSRFWSRLLDWQRLGNWYLRTHHRFDSFFSSPLTLCEVFISSQSSVDQHSFFMFMYCIVSQTHNFVNGKVSTEKKKCSLEKCECPAMSRHSPAPTHHHSSPQAAAQGKSDVLQGITSSWQRRDNKFLTAKGKHDDTSDEKKKSDVLQGKKRWSCQQGEKRWRQGRGRFFTEKIGYFVCWATEKEHRHSPPSLASEKRIVVFSLLPEKMMRTIVTRGKWQDATRFFQHA